MQPRCDEDSLIPLEQALERLLADARTAPRAEYVCLDQAHQRVVAETVTAPLALPPFAASAMDGYAVDSRSARSTQPLAVSQRIAAGQMPEQPLQPDRVARLFTGAPLPEGADTVIPQEACQVEGDRVRLPKEFTPGQFVRRPGSHVAEGTPVFEPGRRLGAADIGMLAALGISRVKVHGRLKVALLTTGNELVEPGRTLQPGQIYDANRYLLSSLLKNFDCEIISPPPVADEAKAVRHALSTAAQQADLIISCGGVSVGEEDYVKEAVTTLGELALWRLRIKPGKPLAFGRVGQTPFIGLPGNPVSSFVTFCLLARPYILKSQGMKEVGARSFPVRADFDQNQPDGRRNFLRVTLHEDDGGELWARPYRSQDSATLLSVSRCDGLLCIPEGETIQHGQRLRFTPFSELIKP